MMSLTEAIAKLKQNDANFTELSVNLKENVVQTEFIQFSHLLATNQTVKSLSISGIHNAPCVNHRNSKYEEPIVIELPNSLFKNLTIIEMKFNDDQMDICKSSKTFMSFCALFNAQLKKAEYSLHEHKLKMAAQQHENTDFITNQILLAKTMLINAYNSYLALVKLSQKFKGIDFNNSCRFHKYLVIHQEISISLANIYSQNPETFSEAYKTLRSLPDTIKKNQILLYFLMTLGSYEELTAIIFENNTEFSMIQLILFLQSEKPEELKSYIYYHLKKIENAETSYPSFTESTNNLEKMILSVIPEKKINSLKAKILQKLDYFFFIDEIRANVKDKKLFIYKYLTRYAKYNSEIAIFLGDYFACSNQIIKLPNNHRLLSLKLTENTSATLDAEKYYLLALELEHPQAPQRIYNFCKHLKEQCHNKEFANENINFLFKKIKEHAGKYENSETLLGKFYFFIYENKNRGTRIFYQSAKTGDINAFYYLFYLAINEEDPKKHILQVKEFIANFYNNNNKELINRKIIKVLFIKNTFTLAPELFNMLENLMSNDIHLAINIAKLYKKNGKINDGVYCYYLACEASNPKQFYNLMIELFKIKIDHPESKSNFYLKKIHSQLISSAQLNDQNIFDKLLYFCKSILTIAENCFKSDGNVRKSLEFIKQNNAYLTSAALIFEYVYNNIAIANNYFISAKNYLESRRIRLKSECNKYDTLWEKTQGSNTAEKVINFLKALPSTLSLFSLFSQKESSISILIKKLEHTKVSEIEGIIVLINHAKAIFEKSPAKCDNQLEPIFFALDKLRIAYYQPSQQQKQDLSETSNNKFTLNP